MVLEKSWVSENFRRISKSRRSKQESRNLEHTKNNARLGISNFEIESPSLANQAKVLISLNRHKTTVTTTAKQRTTVRLAKESRDQTLESSSKNARSVLKGRC